MISFIQNNALMLWLITLGVLLLFIVLAIVILVRRNAKWREKEFRHNSDTELLRVRINELEKENSKLQEREAEIAAEKDNIIMSAQEQADGILEQTMKRVHDSEALIRQNRLVAACCVTDARRKISDMLVEVSKRLVIEDGMLLDASELPKEALEEAAEAQSEAPVTEEPAAEEPAAEEPAAEEPAAEEPAAEAPAAGEPVEEEPAAEEAEEAEEPEAEVSIADVAEKTVDEVIAEYADKASPEAAEAEEEPQPAEQN